MFLANPLLGAVLLMSAAVTTGLKIAKVDTEYAKHGKTPPSYALVEKWLDRRKAAGKAPKSAKVAKPGMWSYAWQRWQAMWEDLTEQHNEVRDQYKTAVAGAKANGKPLPPKPTVKETLTGWQWQIGQLTAPLPAAESATPPAAGDGLGTDQPDPAAPRPSTSSDDSPMPEVPRFYPDAPEDIGKTLDERPTRDPREQHPGGQPGSTGWRCGACGAASTGGFADPRTAAADYGRHVPICPATAATPNEGDPMTQTQSGEVTGIPSAVHYMNQVAATHSQHGGNEQILTAMNTMKIGPGDISLVQQAQEASRNAAELWTTAGDTIERHNAGVREGYGSAPDAADKQAQMAE
ncbi:hypothetical protein ACQP2Y_21410 [Actinoplanes sp. CA-051413]|uniref:hypothetical protein n=1 Tax=Actinoplanes sp. CA-051413 TaxID=3239899 RepID=UPI003D977AAA